MTSAQVLQMHIYVIEYNPRTNWATTQNIEIHVQVYKFALSFLSNNFKCCLSLLSFSSYVTCRNVLSNDIYF